MLTLLYSFNFDTDMWVGPAAADASADSVFAVSSDDLLYQLPVSGPAAPLGGLNLGAYPAFDGLAYAGGSLYGVSSGGLNCEIYKINQATGALTPLNTVPFPGAHAIGDPNSDQLFFVNASGSNLTLVECDPNSSSFSSVPITGFPANVVVSLGWAGGSLYALGQYTSYNSYGLFHVDPGTGAATPVTLNGSTTFALADPSASLYSWLVGDATADELYAYSTDYGLYEFDPGSNSYSTVPLTASSSSPALSLSTNYLEQIVSLPDAGDLYAVTYNTNANVPEPSTFALLAVGAVALIAYRRHGGFWAFLGYRCANGGSTERE